MSAGVVELCVKDDNQLEKHQAITSTLIIMKNFVKKVDDSVLKRRNQANITFTSVQFSGCGQKTKSYKPGMGYVKDSEIGKEVKRKIT